MALTFKSSTPEERVLIARGRDGVQRVCRAVQADDTGRTWNLTLEHPSGMTWPGTYHGDSHTVCVALTKMMMDKENDFKNEAARGHRPEPRMQPDRNVRVDESGGDIGAPMIRRYV